MLSDTEAAEVVCEGGSAEPLRLGERAFEIVLARKVAAEQAETHRFARHGSVPATELPTHWPDAYRRTVEAWIALIERHRDLAQIERPECKRQWATESWEKQQERAPQAVRSVADRVRGDGDLVSVASLWAGAPSAARRRARRRGW